MKTTAEVKEFVDRFGYFLERVECGDEILLMQNQKPIARLVPAIQGPAVKGSLAGIRSFKGHQVLTPQFSQGDLAEEMFSKDDRA